MLFYVTLTGNLTFIGLLSDAKSPYTVPLTPSALAFVSLNHQCKLGTYQSASECQCWSGPDVPNSQGASVYHSVCHWQ
jgi:hypothetical protein